MKNYNYVLVRYGEIGTKSEPVQSDMKKILRQRIEDRLKYENISFEKVSLIQGRILVKKVEEKNVAEKISNIPGVASASPVIKSKAEIKDIKEKVKNLEIGETFGVKVNKHNSDLSTQNLKEEVGGFIESLHSSSVDLDNPETWV
ncbi:MAG: THUMP domain-containing protein, partial [Candidatus Nanohaloarchaea archaeon]